MNPRTGTNNNVIITHSMNKDRFNASFPNGFSMGNATMQQIEQVARTFGYTVNLSGYYRSSTHGLIRIVDMDNKHLTNSICARVRNWAGTLGTLSGKELVKELQNMNAQDNEFIDLVTELVKRVNSGQM